MSTCYMVKPGFRHASGHVAFRTRAAYTLTSTVVAFCCMCSECQVVGHLRNQNLCSPLALLWVKVRSGEDKRTVLSPEAAQKDCARHTESVSQNTHEPASQTWLIHSSNNQPWKNPSTDKVAALAMPTKARNPKNLSGSPQNRRSGFLLV